VVVVSFRSQKQHEVTLALSERNWVGGIEAPNASAAAGCKRQKPYSRRHKCALLVNIIMGEFASLLVPRQHEATQVHTGFHRRAFGAPPLASYLTDANESTPL
jgi:hypothetical protein